MERSERRKAKTVGTRFTRLNSKDRQASFCDARRLRFRSALSPAERTAAARLSCVLLSVVAVAEATAEAAAAPRRAAYRRTLCCVSGAGSGRVALLRRAVVFIPTFVAKPCAVCTSRRRRFALLTMLSLSLSLPLPLPLRILIGEIFEYLGTRHLPGTGPQVLLLTRSLTRSFVR